MVPCTKTAEGVSFEWSHHRILYQFKVSTTLHVHVSITETNYFDSVSVHLVAQLVRTSDWCVEGCGFSYMYVWGVPCYYLHIVHVLVVQFYPWFNFYFLLLLSMLSKVYGLLTLPILGRVTTTA